MKRAMAVIAGLTIMTIVGRADAAPGPGSVTVATGVPTEATAVLANLTMVNGASPGYVTAAPCDEVEGLAAQQSSGNHGTSAAVANLAVVPVDLDGTFCVYHQRSVDLISDVQGYVAPGGLRLVTVDPVRLLDTRPASTAAPATGIVRVETGAPAGTEAVLVNLTMVNATAAGYVTAGRCSQLVDGPQQWSNGNHVVGAATSNLAVVPVDADGSFCIYRQRPVHLVVDLQGTFAQVEDGLGIDVGEPRRVLDTRTGPTPEGGDVVRVDTGLAAGTAAALVNITMVDGRAAGYVTADRCSTLVAGPQRFSNGNHLTGAAVSNLGVVPLDPDGSFCIYRQQAVQLTVDVQGSFSESAAGGLHLVDQRRVLDTRPVLPTTSCTSVVHIGDSTSVGLISSSILPDPADRVDAQYRRVGVADPRTEISGARSIVERLPGQLNAYEAAQNEIASGFHGCWVFALGTTDTANVAAGSNVSRRTRIDMMMGLAAGAPVLWVNARTIETSEPWGDQNMQAWNAELEAAAARYPNLRVYDWASVAQVAWFSADKVHYTPEGYRQRAHLIADALATAFPG